MKKIVKSTYACEICSHEFDTPQNALECEKRGLALPEFKEYEVVEFANLRGVVKAQTISGFKIQIKNGTKAIIKDDTREDLPNPHLLPLEYDVWVHTPGKTIGDRVVFRETAGSVGRKNLRKVHIVNGNMCPLCNMTLVQSNQDKSYLYLGLDHKIPFLAVEVQVCLYCNAKFFTTEQARKAEALTRKKVKWPIADTKKLVKEDAFEW